MELYEVVYEVRQLGAIGVFQLMKGTVLANSVEDAKERFRQQHINEFEFRFCYGCTLFNV